MEDESRQQFDNWRALSSEWGEPTLQDAYLAGWTQSAQPHRRKAISDVCKWLEENSLWPHSPYEIAQRIRGRFL